MSYKKFINRNGKAYGPYIYESKRDGGKVVSHYQGKSKSRNNFLLVLGIILIISAGFLSIQFFQPTGKVVLQLSPVYSPNETIFGDLKIKLKPGELLPADSIVSFKLNNQQIELPISQVLDINSSQGKFYAENVNLEGEGEGYGFIGERVSYPEVSFKLLVYQAGIADNQEVTEIPVPEIELNETTETPASETQASEIPQESTSQPESSTTEESSESPASQITETPTQTETPVAPTESSPPVAESAPVIETPAEAPAAAETPVAPTESSPITGGIIAESKIVDGTVIYGKEYIYALSSGESATIVQGSIKTSEDNLSLENLNLVVEENQAKVTTNYYKSEKGFGRDYLVENEQTIDLSLKEMGFKAEVGILEVAIVYNNIEIAEAASKIMISEENSSAIVNITQVKPITNKTSIVTPINVSNNFTQTKARKIAQKIETLQQRAVIGKPVKWEKKIELNEASNISVELPKEAENIVVNKVENGQETEVSQENVQVVGITGQVSLELELGRENGFVRFLKKVWSSITGKAVQEVISEEGVAVNIDEQASQYSIEYETPAPEAFEKKEGDSKIIKVSGPDEVHYQEVLAYSNLNPEIEDSRIKMYHFEGDKLVQVNITKYDLNENGLIDYVEWNVPKLSSQTYALVIEISKAEHLDSEKNLIEDIFDKVIEQDDNWTETINNGEYVRVNFERNLTFRNDITVFARDSSSRIEVYEKDSNISIATISNIREEKYYKTLLTSLGNRSQAIFDLKILGQVEFDHIIDPDCSGVLGSTDCSKILSSGDCILGYTSNLCSWTTDTCYNTASGITQCSDLINPQACDSLSSYGCSGYDCTGTIMACNYISDPATCEYAGCDWGYCTGYITNCNQITDQTTCNALSGYGCNWGYCYGNPMGCAAITDSSYCTSAGCSWSEGACTGMTSYDCSWITNPSVCSGYACSYNSMACSPYAMTYDCDINNLENSISGGYANCQSYTSSACYGYGNCDPGDMIGTSGCATLAGYYSSLDDSSNCGGYTSNQCSYRGYCTGILSSASSACANVGYANCDYVSGYCTKGSVCSGTITACSDLSYRTCDDYSGYGCTASAYVITNVPSGLGIYDSNGIVDYTSTAQSGPQSALLKKGSQKIAYMNVNFDSTKDFSDLDGSYDNSGNTKNGRSYPKSFVKVPASHTEVSNIKLVLDTDTKGTQFVHICPGASSIMATTDSCTDGYSAYVAYSGYYWIPVTGTGAFETSNTSLVIWDQNDSGMPNGNLGAFSNQQIKFYANYSDLASGLSINGTDKYCNISFNDSVSWKAMDFNSSSLFYEYNRTFTTSSYIWNVSCNDTSGGYDYLAGNDTLVVTDAPSTCPNSWSGAGTQASPCLVTDCGSLSTANLYYKLVNSTISDFNGTCFILNASYVDFDLNGNIVDGIDMAASNNEGFGLYISSGVNGTSVRGGTISDFGYGIYVLDSSNNTLNDLNVNSNTGYGIWVYGNLGKAADNIISNSSSISNAYDLQIMISNSLADNGYNYLRNYNVGSYYFSGFPMNASLSFENSSAGVIKFSKGLSTSWESNLNNDLKISNNSVSVNVNSTYQALNISANVTLYGIGNRFSNPVILRNNIAPCNESSTPSCHNFTALNADTVIFNVSSWSNYSIGEAPSAAAGSTCQELNTANSVYTLNNNVNSTSTCFNVTANNVTLNGNGYEINYSSDGAPGAWGVYISEGVNLTRIKNIIIKEGTGTATYPFAHSIYCKNSENVTIENSTITSLSSGSWSIQAASCNNINISGSNISWGVSLASLNSASVRGNTISTLSFGGASALTNSSVLYNNLSAVSTSGFGYSNLNFSYNNLALFDSNYGIDLFFYGNNITWNNTGANMMDFDNTANNIKILNNRITKHGINGGAIDFSVGNNIAISNNIINGDATYGAGVSLISSNNTLENNTIINGNLNLNGDGRVNNFNITYSVASSFGLYVEGAYNITNGTILVTGSGSHGIRAYPSSLNTDLYFENIVSNAIGSNSYAFWGSQDYCDLLPTEIEIRDSVLNSSNQELYSTGAPADCVIINATNVTKYNNILFTKDVTNIILNVFWYLDLNVTNSASSSVYANVTLIDKQNITRFSEYSNSGTGLITRKTIQEYGLNSTNSIYYTPLNITAVNSSYATYSNSSINLSSSLNLNIIMGAVAGDNTPPYVAILSPQNTTYNYSVINLNITNSSDTQAVWYMNSTGNFSYTQPIYFNLTNGAYTWYAYANDSNNNRNETSISFYVNYTAPDSILPQVRLVYPTNSSYNINISSLNYTSSDANLQACWYSTNGGLTNTSVACGTNLTGLTSVEGTNTWLVGANDSSGNRNSSVISFTKDTVLPTINIISPLNSTYNLTTLSFNVSLSEDADTCKLRLMRVGSGLPIINNLAMTKLNNTYFNYTKSALTDGYQFYVNFTCNDTSNNLNNTVLRYFVINTSYSPAGGTENTTVVEPPITPPTGGGGCSSECSAGNLRCSGSDLQNCATTHDVDPCYEWGKLETCLLGCSNNACIQGICTENWACTDWGKCQVGIMRRNCTDSNNCGTKSYKPDESKICTIAPLTLEYSPSELNLILPEGKEQKFSAIAIEQSDAGEIPIISRWYADNIKLQEDAGINSVVGLFKIAGSKQVKLEVFDIYNNQQVVWNIRYVNASGCREDWVCEWTACSNEGYTSPKKCIDKSACGTNADYPTISKCGDVKTALGGACTPNLKCTDWGECQVNYKMSDVVKNKIETSGIQRRTCVDKAGCYDKERFEERNCNLARAVSVKTVEWCNENYVEICDAETKQIVSRIRESGFDKASLERKESITGNFLSKLTLGLITGASIKGADISLIVANFTGYCEYCYDNVKNYDETSVDCGGPNCPVCEDPSRIMARDFSKWYKHGLWTLFVILLVAYLVYLYKTSSKAREKHHKKAHESLMNKIKGFEDRELKEWGIRK